MTEYTDADAPTEDGMRPPQHDLLAEQSVIGAMMRDSNVIDDVQSAMEPTDFWHGKHELIARVIVALHAKDLPTDMIAVGTELATRGELERAGGIGYVYSLPDMVPTSSNAAYYAEVVKQHAVRRRLAEAGERITNMGYASEGAVEELVESARKELDQVHVSRRGPVRMIGQTFHDLFVSLEEKPTYVPTPWESLDKLIGGFAPGELIVVAARPGEGKSIALLQAAARMAKVGLIAFCSLEMSEQELQTRLLSQVASVSMKSLRDHTLTTEEWHALADARSVTQEAPIFVDDSEAMTVASIRAHARAVARRGKLVAVFVDYLQLVDGDGPDRRVVVDGVSKALKQLAKSLNVPVVAAAQLNRGERGRGKERPLPTLRDLREAGGIENNADAVILLHRDTERHPDDVKAIVAKNRHGGLGMVTLRWEGQYARFMDRRWTPYGLYEQTDMN